VAPMLKRNDIIKNQINALKNLVLMAKRERYIIQYTQILVKLCYLRYLLLNKNFPLI